MLTESAMTESLDARGLLAAARGPGVYALRCAVPDDAAAVREALGEVSDADPPEGYAERLAAAERVAYVGASGDVYDRLCDHAAGDVRKATFLRAFPPERVVDVWPHDDPWPCEHKRALKLARREGWLAWTNGQMANLSGDNMNTDNTDGTPRTKADAYRAVLDRGEDVTLRKQVAAHIAKDPATTPELAARLSGRSKNAIRPRVNELLRMGCVRREGTRTTASGHEAFVHHITTTGQRYLAGECDPDPDPPLSELAVDVVDVARRVVAGQADTDDLHTAVARYDGAKQRRNPDWQPPVTLTTMTDDTSNTDDDSTDGGDDIPAELTREEYEQIQADPVLTVGDVVGGSDE